MHDFAAAARDLGLGLGFLFPVPALAHGRQDQAIDLLGPRLLSQNGENPGLVPHDAQGEKAVGLVLSVGDPTKAFPHIGSGRKSPWHF
jgi:hypothetical protein